MFNFNWQAWGIVALAFLLSNAASWNIGGSVAVAKYEKAIADRSAAAERNRSDVDAQTRELSDYDLCIRDLSAKRMPIKPCEQLRGVPAQ